MSSTSLSSLDGSVFDAESIYFSDSSSHEGSPLESKTNNLAKEIIHSDDEFLLPEDESIIFRFNSIEIPEDEEPLLDIAEQKETGQEDINIFEEIDPNYQNNNFFHCLRKNYTSREIHIICKLLNRSSDFKEKFLEWMQEYNNDSSHEVKAKVKKNLQKEINRHIGMKDILKIIFHDKIAHFKQNTNSTCLSKVKYFGKEAVAGVGGIVFSPLISTYKIGKTLIVNKKRKALFKGIKKFITTGKLSYNARHNLAGHIIKIGAAGVIGSVVAAEILSLGLATPIIIGFGSAAGAAAIATVANDCAKGKHPAVTTGQIVGESIEGSLSGAIAGAAAVGYAKVGIEVVTASPQTVAQDLHKSFIIQKALSSPNYANSFANHIKQD